MGRPHETTTRFALVALLLLGLGLGGCATTLDVAGVSHTDLGEATQVSAQQWQHALQGCEQVGAEHGPVYLGVAREESGLGVLLDGADRPVCVDSLDLLVAELQLELTAPAIWRSQPIVLSSHSDPDPQPAIDPMRAGDPDPQPVTQGRRILDPDPQPALGSGDDEDEESDPDPQPALDGAAPVLRLSPVRSDKNAT